MKCFILSCIVLLASGQSSEEDSKNSKDGGLYFDAQEVAMACTAGTPAGAKFARALAFCSGAAGEEEIEVAVDGTSVPPTEGTTYPTSTAMPVVVNRKRKACKGRKCKGKGKKKCPSVADIKEKVGSEMEDDLCVLNQMGWIDAEGQADDAVMTADLMTLPTDVSAKLSEAKVEQCAEKMVEKMSKKHRRCAKMYNEADMAELSEMGMKVASLKCFQKQFAKSCQAFVKEEIYNFYKEKMNQEPAVWETTTTTAAETTTTTAADTTTTTADTTTPIAHTTIVV